MKVIPKPSCSVDVPNGVFASDGDPAFLIAWDRMGRLGLVLDGGVGFSSIMRGGLRVNSVCATSGSCRGEDGGWHQFGGDGLARRGLASRFRGGTR